MHFDLFCKSINFDQFNFGTCYFPIKDSGECEFVPMYVYRYVLEQVCVCVHLCEYKYLEQTNFSQEGGCILHRQVSQVCLNNLLWDALFSFREGGLLTSPTTQERTGTRREKPFYTTASLQTLNHEKQ